jgi:hypothetical protein
MEIKTSLWRWLRDRRGSEPQETKSAPARNERRAFSFHSLGSSTFIPITHRVFSLSDASPISEDVDPKIPKVVTSTYLCDKCWAFMTCEIQRYFRCYIWRADGYVRTLDKFQLAVRQKCAICRHLWRRMDIDAVNTDPPEAIRLVADPISWPSNALQFALESKRFDKALDRVVVERLADYVLGASPLKGRLPAAQSDTHCLRQRLLSPPALRQYILRSESGTGLPLVHFLSDKSQVLWLACPGPQVATDKTA